MSNLRLRPYRTKDSEKIVEWYKDERTFYRWCAGILGEYPITSEQFDKAMSNRIDSDNFFPFVAFNEEGIQGFFTMRVPGDDNTEIRFGFVIVNPEIRGEGYGKQMLELGKKFAFEVYKCKRISLGVFADNILAYKCYKSIGFTELGSTSESTFMVEKGECIELEMFIEKQNLQQITLEDKNGIQNLSELATSILKEYYDPIIGSEQNDYMLKKFQSVEGITQQLEEGYNYYIYNLDGIGVGLVGFYQRGDEMYISKYYIHKDFRNKGIGRKLLKFVESEALKKDIYKITLNVNRFNDTIEKYKKMGFAIIKEEKNDIGQGFIMDDYVMCKDLLKKK